MLGSKYGYYPSTSDLDVQYRVDSAIAAIDDLSDFIFDKIIFEESEELKSINRKKGIER